MKDEEGGGEKQRLVHRLPLSHVPLARSLTVTPLTVPVGEEEEEEEEEEGVLDPSQSPPHAEGEGSPAGGRLQLPVTENRTPEIKAEVQCCCCTTAPLNVFTSLTQSNAHNVLQRHSTDVLLT